MKIELLLIEKNVCEWGKGNVMRTRKLTALLLALAMVCLAGCGKKRTEPKFHPLAKSL